MAARARAKESKEMDALVLQFTSVTGASSKDARRYLTKYRRLDLAVDAYYSDLQAGKPAASTSRLNSLFDRYKDSDGDDITVDGTIKLCEDLAVNPEDVVLLAVAYELKSPSMGEWSRKGWTDGWKQLGVDTIDGFKATLATLRQQLATDTEYFRQVYNYTFEFSRPSGQRSLALDMAQGFWALLIPHGLSGGALSHIVAPAAPDDDGDEHMVDGATAEEGWGEQHTTWWFEFLEENGTKGVSKDVWQMFLEFVRTIDARFEKYDVEGSWPSTIDDFVEFAKKRVGGRA
ncbi:Cullin binding-domain-containing protein [Ganoderma leucocontextum]|nr:Cullin binding-domain-containing protein [Ganoderma leucocontextum]